MTPPTNATAEPTPALRFSGSIPMVMLVAAIGQIGMVLWQAGQVTAELRSHDARIGRLENAAEALAKDMAGRSERLAQILARLDATVEQLGHAIQRMDRRAEGNPK